MKYAKFSSVSLQSIKLSTNPEIGRSTISWLCFSPSKPVTIARSVGIQVQTEDKIKGRIGILTLQNHKIQDYPPLPTEKFTRPNIAGGVSYYLKVVTN